MGLFDFFRKGKYGGIRDTGAARLAHKILLPQYKKLKNENNSKYLYNEHLTCDYSLGYYHGLIQMSLTSIGNEDGKDLFATIEFFMVIMFKSRASEIYEKFELRNNLCSFDYESGFKDGSNFMLAVIKREGEMFGIDEYDWYNKLKIYYRPI